jgi:hypothetical protein
MYIRHTLWFRTIRLTVVLAVVVIGGRQFVSILERWRAQAQYLEGRSTSAISPDGKLVDEVTSPSGGSNSTGEASYLSVTARPDSLSPSARLDAIKAALNEQLAALRAKSARLHVGNYRLSDLTRYLASLGDRLTH